MSIYLVTRPEHDDTTFYLSSWCKETIVVAGERGIKVLDLHREKANRDEFEQRISKFSPHLVVLNGHGSENMVCGHRNQPLVVAEENENILRSKIVYAISCRSAQNLGPKSIHAGAVSYTGYSDDFIFVYEPGAMSRPLTDETAKFFLEHAQVFISSLLKGNTVEAALERSRKVLKENFTKMLSSGNTTAARYLWWDLRNFISHGNNKATLN